MALLFWILGLTAFADEPNWSSPAAERLLNEGLDALFNYDLILADSKFDSLVQVERNRPEGYAFKSVTAFWKYLLSEREKDYQDLLKRADLAHEKIEAYLDAHIQSPRSRALATFFLAEHHLQMGGAEARRQSFASAAIHLHKAKGLYKDALFFDSTFYDAAKGVGFMEFFSSLIPESYQWIAAVFGYEGSRQEGMKKLELSRDKGIYTRRESAFYLAMLNYLFYNRVAEAEKELLRLSSIYPQSAALNYALGSFYFKLKNIEKSQFYLDAAIQARDRDAQNEFSGYALFRRAELLFRLNKFAEAKKDYEQYLSILDLSLYHAQTYFKLGLCEAMLGNDSGSLKCFENAVAKTDSPDERYARRKAKQFLERKISEQEKNLLLARNAFDAGDYKTAFEKLLAMLQQEAARSVDERAELYYRLARCYDETKQDQEAILFYQKCYNLRAERERYFAPQSRFHLGRLYARQGKKKIAKDELEKALRYVSYDFEKELRREVKIELEVLDEEKK